MIKIIFSLFAIFSLLFTGVVSYAKTSDNNSPKLDLSQFEKVGDISFPSKIDLPTVFRLDKNIITRNSRNSLVVVDQNGNKAQAFTRFIDTNSKLPNINIKALSPTKQFDGFMNDSKLSTFTEFDLDKDNGKASFEVDFGETKPLEGVQISFADNVKNPESIEILGQNLDNKFTIVAKSNYNSFLSYFPPTKVSKITVNLYHTQVLRVNEVYPQFGLGSPKEQDQNEWFFMAIPGSTYRAFILENDGFSQGSQTLDANLGYTIQDATVGQLKTNLEFINKDTDKDGIKDLQDNCPLVSNPDQTDKDKNGIGDACEDRDLDGVVDAKDNCPLISNPDQSDFDKDGKGDACDNFDNRFLETNTWIVPVAITICSILVILVFAGRLKKIGD